mmetsp:Transcript_7761/g.8001  ORF Transcript_7761/g.8001 Transcript_7761/m.8001 type:complete len:152 (+) Transcript_7761:21-476(+)
MQHTKKAMNFYKFQTRGYFNNGLRSNSILFDRRHNNLRVISTPEFPVPYYQRITRADPAPEQQLMDLNNLNKDVSMYNVIRVKSELAQTSEGLKVLEFVENKLPLESYTTEVNTVSTQADIYTEDLVDYIDAAHEENTRILKKVDLADCLM